MRPRRRSGSSFPSSPRTSTSTPGSGTPTDTTWREPSTTSPRLVSAAGSSGRARQPRPGGVKVTANAASESPYTGVSARASKPKGAKRAAKRRRAAGATGSAPSSAKRHAERSWPARSSSLTRSAAYP